MEQDEAGTLARLKARRCELIDPAIAARGGRVVKLMGDDALVEFASVITAVQCAVEIQSAMVGRNAEEESANPSLGALQVLEVADHALARRRVGQAAAQGGHVLPHVVE